MDITLHCHGQPFLSQKLVLTTCSDYFKNTLQLTDTSFTLHDKVNPGLLGCLLNFMHHGEVNLKESDFPSFVELAKALQIKGLSQANEYQIVKVNTEPDDVILDQDLAEESPRKYGIDDESIVEELVTSYGMKVSSNTSNTENDEFLVT